MSGIVRKIDDLGRIVIPKEIRKSLNIRNNDDIEISINENKIVLSKYYRLKTLEEKLLKYTHILDKYLSIIYLITDKEKVICSSKNSNINVEAKLSTNYIKMLEERKQIIENSIKPLPLYDEKINKCYLINPIIINTDILGSVVLISDFPIKENDKTILDIFIFLLRMNLE